MAACVFFHIYNIFCACAFEAWRIGLGVGRFCTLLGTAGAAPSSKTKDTRTTLPLRRPNHHHWSQLLTITIWRVHCPLLLYVCILRRARELFKHILQRYVFVLLLVCLFLPVKCPFFENIDLWRLPLSGSGN